MSKSAPRRQRITNFPRAARSGLFLAGERATARNAGRTTRLVPVVGKRRAALGEGLVGEPKGVGAVTAEVVRAVLQMAARLAQSVHGRADFRMRLCGHSRRGRRKRLSGYCGRGVRSGCAQGWQRVKTKRKCKKQNRNSGNLLHRFSSSPLAMLFGSGGALGAPGLMFITKYTDAQGGAPVRK